MSEKKLKKSSKTKQKIKSTNKVEFSHIENLNNITKGIKCFQTPDNECYAILNDKYRFLYSLKSKDFRDYLKSEYYKKCKKMPPLQALQDFINILEHLSKSRVRQIFTRIGDKKEAIYINLGDKKHRAVKITPDGLKHVSRPAAYFQNKKGTLPLQITQPKHSRKIIKRFMRLINTSESGQNLIIAWLLCALNSKGPYPILILQGEQGSGKSTVAKMLKMLIDPTIAPLRALHRSERNLAIYAKNNWVLAFDNVSSISDEISDALCRLSTGGGLSTRQLFADTDEVIFDVTRPMILNGIGNIVSKEDLSDRSLVVNMNRIKDENRKTEEEIRNDFEKNKALILGALVCGISSALKNRNNVEIPEYPRMADSLKWIVAAEPAIFNKTGKFIRAFNKNRKNIGFNCLEADSLAAAIKNLIDGRNGKWKGVPNDLLNVLEEKLPDEHKERIMKEKSWPKAANSLSKRLKQLAPTLRSVGILITFGRSATRRTISIKKLQS